MSTNTRVRSVAVTGANGRLARRLIPFLRENGLTVYGLGRTAASEIVLDLCDENAVSRAISDLSPDVVVHLAAMTNVDACEQNCREAFISNALTTRNIAGSLKTSGGKLIFISSDQVYSGTGPHQEQDACPVNVYGLTKLLGEQYAMLGPCVNLRTNYVGRSDDSGRPSLSDWVINNLEFGKQIPVFDDILFNPLHVDELCKMIGIVVRDPLPGTYNLGSQGGISKADFAHAVAIEMKYDTELLLRTRSSAMQHMARRPCDMRMNCSLFCAAYGVALPPVEDCIHRLITEYRSC